MAKDALEVAGSAFSAEENRPEAMGAGVRALLQYVSDNDLFARLAFFELPTAGPVALDEADEVLDRFIDFLQADRKSHESGSSLGTTTLHAIATGIWATIQHELLHGGRESLPELAPQITWIALAPTNA